MDLRQSLNIKIESPYWDSAYQKALSEPGIPWWLTEKYIRLLQNEKGVLPNSAETLVSVIPHITSVPDLCLLAKTLYHLIGTKKNFSSVFTKVEFPKAQAGENTIGYDCFSIFPVLAHILPTWEELKSRGVPYEVLTDSLQWADSIFTQSSAKAGKPFFGEDFFKLYGVCVYINHLTVGSLRFEIYENSLRPVRIFKNNQGEFCPLIDGEMIHKSGHILGSLGAEDSEGSYLAGITETDSSYVGYSAEKNTRLVKKEEVTLSKSSWKQVYSSGDTAIKVHIPYGKKITKEACKDSYKRAKEIFTRCFPEYKFKCFLICCWMLSPLLKEILPTDSNIIDFQREYVIFPMRNSALDVFLYVYGIEASSIEEISFLHLPEKTSLQWGIKKKLMSGDYIHQFGGYMPL